MSDRYFNYQHKLMTGGWDRRGFVRHWWRFYKNDPKYTPPYYPALRQALDPGRNPHLARLEPLFVQTEALQRRSATSPYGLNTMGFEFPVAMAVILGDDRRNDNTAYFSLPRSVNDSGPLKRLLTYLLELLGGRGYRRLIGPTGLSPHLGPGLLQDHWDVLPPLHTPYAPPYMPEIFDITWRPFARSQLYHLAVPPEPPPSPPERANFTPFDPTRLATDLLPLLVAACPAWADFPPPDGEEADFLLRWLSRWPLFGWLAQVDDRPVGFVLLQPDLAPRLRLAKGGRNLLWRVWLKWAAGRPTRHGRVPFGGVLPDWRGQGIGSRLLHQALLTAQNQRWQSLTFGPLPTMAPGVKFLKHRGAAARQFYLLYQYEF